MRAGSSAPAATTSSPPSSATPVRRHPATASATATTTASATASEHDIWDMGGASDLQQLPRTWSDEGDRTRKPKAPLLGGPGLGLRVRARLLTSAVARRALLPIVRWWWPCTPRKIARNVTVLVVLSVALFLSCEAFGRLRYNGYLSGPDEGNGAMGFYHEMDIDMQALQLASQHPQSKLYPANAVNAREVKAWIAERQRRTNGRKFLIGCSADWRGYVLRSFLHLFEDLKANHGWDDLVTDDPLDYFYRQDPRKAPSVLFFCLSSFRYPFYLFLDHNKYFQELRALGTLIVVWSDDLQYFDQFDTGVVRERILKRADVLVGSYSYLTDDYFASVTAPMNARDLPLLSWLPHSAGPDFVKAPLNEHPIDKILLSGRLGSNWYPLRHWLGEYQAAHGDRMDLYKHSGYYVAANQSEIYASYLRSYRVGVTTTLIHQFLVAKVFEIPSTGALLLLNSDLAPLLEALDLHEMEHFVTFDRRDPERALAWVLDPVNREQVDAIRRAGMALVRDYHMVRNRVLALDLFLTEGVVTYAYPPSLRIGAPCPSVALPSQSACEASFLWNARHKCDLWFCGVRSLFHKEPK